MAANSTPATIVLAGAKIAFTVHPYEHDPRAQSYGLEAAEALGVEPSRVFKTLMVSVDGELCVGIVPVDMSLDLKSVAGALGGKRASMAALGDAERATGYVAGGISPLGQKRPHRTVIDETSLLWDTVYVSGGRRGLDIALAPDDLIALTGAVVVDIAR